MRALSTIFRSISLVLFVVASAAVIQAAPVAQAVVNCQFWIDPATNKSDCHGDCPPAVAGDPAQQCCVTYPDANTSKCGRDFPKTCPAT